MDPHELNCARALLGYYQPGAPGAETPGGFQSAFIRLLEVSDSKNQASLLNTFPEWIPAVRICMDEGAAALEQRIANNRTLTIIDPDGDVLAIIDVTGKGTLAISDMAEEILSRFLPSTDYSYVDSGPAA